MISVIVPVYNVQKYIRRCLDCLAEQTLKDIEILLIDDGSTDGSGDICDEYVEKFKNFKVYHKENGGVSTARNLGIEMASGDYIAFVDADDCVDLDFCEILLNALMQTDSDIAACSLVNEYGGKYVINKSWRSIPEYIVFDGTKNILESVTSSENSIEGYIWNKVWKRSLIGNHRFRKDISICEDLFFLWETLKDAERACFVGLSMYHYLIQLSSSSHSINFEKYEGALWIHEIMIEDAKNVAPNCVQGLIGNYINWNLKLSEIMMVSKKFDSNIYQKIRENLRKNKAIILKSDFRHRLLANALLHSWNSYVFKAGIVWKLKKFYIKIKN